MENNGKDSISKRTKHTNIRYYFVTDHIGKYELSLECCPTADMIEYFMIKPTQGAAFKKLWDHLVVVTEAQEPCQGNPKKVCEDK